MFFYKILAFTIHAKYKKNYKKQMNLKNQLRHGMNSLN